MYLEDPYGNKQQGHLQHKDIHNNSGDGSTSSSEQKQPKKVMYEAVV